MDTTFRARNFAEILGHYEDRNRWTKQEAAAAVGVTLNGYIRYRNAYPGYERPGRDIVIKYAKGFDADEDEFLAAAGYLPESSGYSDTILSSNAHWRLTQIKEMQPELIAIVEEYIGVLYVTAQKLSKSS